MKRIIAIVLVIVLLVGLTACGQEPTPEFSVNVPEQGSPCKYHFEQLTAVEKQAYNAVLEKIQQFPEQIEVPKLTKEELSNFYTALLYDNPVLFFLGNAPSVRQSSKHSYFVPEYLMGEQDYNAMLRKCESIAEKILSSAKRQPTDFDKELTVHDLLVNQCSYNDDNTDDYRNSIYGALCGSSAGCEGYAKTAKYLLDQLDIPCYVITGKSTPPGSQTQSHMWNVVQIGGEYYHLDLTWDDPVLEKGGNVISHTYFNVDDASIRKTHSEYKNMNPCLEMTDNYFVHEHLLFMDYGAPERERTVSVAVDALQRGSDGFQLKFVSEAAYLKAQTALVDEGGIYSLLSEINEELTSKIATDRVYYFCTDSERTFEIVVER